MKQVLMIMKLEEKDGQKRVLVAMLKKKQTERLDIILQRLIIKINCLRHFFLKDIQIP
jgi:hypothetical protein